MAYITLDHQEGVVVERGAMAAMSEGVSSQGALAGGVVRSAARKVLGGESFFTGRYRAEAHGAWIAVAPPFPGDLAVVQITPSEPLLCEQGAMVAHAESVEADVRYAGIKNMVLREGATVLRLHGDGQAIISSYGGLQKFDLGQDESLVVDTGHLVAWTQSCTTQIGLLGGAVNSAMTGEGIVARITGPGRVYIQTRAEKELRSWLFPERAQNTGNHGRSKH